MVETRQIRRHHSSTSADVTAHHLRCFVTGMTRYLRNFPHVSTRTFRIFR
jgi:hypothetical protein